MKVSIIGGGSFGTALAQVLCDNGHEPLIRDINEDFVKKINEEHLHPFFDMTIPHGIKASTNLEEVINHSEIVLLALPTKVMRSVIKEIGTILKEPKIFVNVSKGIEPGTSKLVSEILEEELTETKVKGFVCISGPSFAEEICQRKATTLVSASTNIEHAKLLQKLFTNDKYMRVYSSNDVIGVEVCGAVKNAIALASGMAEGMKLGMNARAALLTRGNREIIKLVKIMGGNEETCYGLAGIGDLILTASSTQSRNFQAGFRLGQGETLDSIMATSKNVVEGVRAVEACYEIGQKNDIELPIINLMYHVLYNNFDISNVVQTLLNRDLKSDK